MVDRIAKGEVHPSSTEGSTICDLALSEETVSTISLRKTISLNTANHQARLALKVFKPDIGVRER